MTRLLAVAMFVVAVIAFRTLPVTQWLVEVEAWVGRNPVAGALAYLLATVVAVVAMVPGWIPMMLAGLVFGVAAGIALGAAGITVGAIVAFVIGRTLARDWVEDRIAGNERMLALDDALDEQAFKIVALSRVALVIPFNLLNYAYGLTRVNTRTYSLATALGMLPIVALYAWLGTLARDIPAIISGEARPEGGAWWIAGIAVVVIVIVALIVRRSMRRALDRRSETTDDSHDE